MAISSSRAKRTLLLTSLVYLFSASFCDKLSLPQEDPTLIGRSTQPSLQLSELDWQQTEKLVREFRDWQEAFAAGYPRCKSQENYNFEPCYPVW
jgi:hypothetical protein